MSKYRDIIWDAYDESSSHVQQIIAHGLMQWLSENECKRFVEIYELEETCLNDDE